MRRSMASGEKPVEQAGKLRTRKAKLVRHSSGGLECVSRDSTEHKKAEDALRESEEKYRDLFENAQEGIITLDLQARITAANRLVEEYGLKRKDLIGKKLFDFVPEYDRARAVSDFEILVGGKAVKGQMDVITPKGIITVEYRDTPIVREGKVIGVQAILTDITERKKAEDRLRLYSEITVNMSEGVYVIRASDGVIIYTNPKFEEMFGYGPSELMGKHVSVVNAPSEKSPQNTAEEIIEVLNQEGSWCGEILNIKKDRTPFWCYASVSTFEHPKHGNVWVSMHTDITERKKAEEKLLEHEAQLKFLASQLTLSEERERRRIATELHDRIGQSLAVSKIKLDGLRHSVSPEDPVKVMEQVSSSLGQAIADIRSLTFDLSSPILHELGFEAAVAAWLVDKIEQEHGIVTEFEDDGQAEPLDEDVRALLFRNVQELLFNVVKHANAHKVKVSIRRIGSRIRVSVQDDGVGFDPAKVALRSIREGGFGLFSIRERLEQLGGHLQIDSAPGRGCTVTMTAPIKKGVIVHGKI